MQTNIGLRRFPLFFSASAPHSKWIWDLQSSSAELVYEEPLRIPGELVTQTAHPVDPANLTTQLRQHMTRLRPVPATRHASPGTSVHKDLQTCTHVFLRQYATRKALEPPYSGPYQVLSRQEKTLKLLVRGKPITVSTDRVKPAYILHEANFKNTACNPVVKATPPIAPPATPPATSSPPTATRTTHSGNHVHFLVCFNTKATITARGGGGDVGPSHMSDIRQMSVATQRLVDLISMVTNSKLLRKETVISVGSALTLQLGAVTQKTY
jgi:hypothetical protein